MNSYYWLLFVSVPIIIIAVSIYYIFWFYRRSDECIRSWAESNGYLIITKQLRSFARGPYFWSASKSQSVYRVTIREGTGRTRNGWVRCGSFWRGLASDEVEVKWDDEDS